LLQIIFEAHDQDTAATVHPFAGQRRLPGCDGEILHIRTAVFPTPPTPIRPEINFRQNVTPSSQPRGGILVTSMSAASCISTDGLLFSSAGGIVCPFPPILVRDHSAVIAVWKS